MTEMPAGLFARESGRYVPDPICAGPWDAGAMHGGPPTALFGRTVVDHEADPGDWHLSRLTVELVRPIPIAPLAIELELVRPGRRVQLVDAVMRTTEGLEVALARGLRIRHGDNGLDEDRVVHPDPPHVPAPETQAKIKYDYDRPFGEFFLGALEIRPVGIDAFSSKGPAQVWFKLLIPVLAGTPIQPLDRALTAADFPNGISRVVDPEHFQFINPDLTVNLHRHPEGEWVLLDGMSHVRRGGYGTAQAVLSDRSGLLGTSVQSLLVAAAR